MFDSEDKTGAFLYNASNDVSSGFDPIQKA
jgi:hypothetical protein